MLADHLHAIYRLDHHAMFVNVILLHIFCLSTRPPNLPFTMTDEEGGGPSDDLYAAKTSQRHAGVDKWAAGYLWSSTGMNMIAGTVGGLAGVIVGHPFDTIKVDSTLCLLTGIFPLALRYRSDCSRRRASAV